MVYCLPGGGVRHCLPREAANDSYIERIRMWRVICRARSHKRLRNLRSLSDRKGASHRDVSIGRATTALAARHHVILRVNYFEDQHDSNHFL